MTHTPCRNCNITYDAHAEERITFCPLHAAAPELLAALKKAIARHTDFAWAPWTDEARAAIAKAEPTT